jgi:hypothetical protein
MKSQAEAGALITPHREKVSARCYPDVKEELYIVGLAPAEWTTRTLSSFDVTPSKVVVRAFAFHIMMLVGLSRSKMPSMCYILSFILLALTAVSVATIETFDYVYLFLPPFSKPSI